ncbi:hypothetical protein K443DRAFT_686150 [Laccaria amethystina LaAM-08-1]|uniref:Uncharacterized protein n=1 Tax=Laccaria amethystina LaAM-08-1 TaxID=1095629 RepID=A0A0C9X432_9AGAR|nr:hypothetical protein K443DRAFT_686150 [Laccaria amethystina LaAM-08-1]
MEQHCREFHQRSHQNACQCTVHPMPYGISWGNIAENFTNVTPPAIGLSTRLSEGKKRMHCFNVTLDNFIDRIRRCAISRIMEIRCLRIRSAVGLRGPVPKTYHLRR